MREDEQLTGEILTVIKALKAVEIARQGADGVQVLPFSTTRTFAPSRIAAMRSFASFWQGSGQPGSRASCAHLLLVLPQEARPHQKPGQRPEIGHHVRLFKDVFKSAMNENAAQSGKNPRAQREQPGQALFFCCAVR